MLYAKQLGITAVVCLILVGALCVEPAIRLFCEFIIMTGEM